MIFLFVSLACFALFAAIFAATFAIDHFASMWQTADANSRRGHFSYWAANSKNARCRKRVIGPGVGFRVFGVFCRDILCSDVCGRWRRKTFRALRHRRTRRRRETLREFSATQGRAEPNADVRICGQPPHREGTRFKHIADRRRTDAYLRRQWRLLRTGRFVA